MSGFKFITAKKTGKSRIAKSTFKSVVRTLKTVPPPPLIDIEEVEKKPPTKTPLPQIKLDDIPYLTYLKCIKYEEKHSDMICKKIKTEMGMDITTARQDKLLQDNIKKIMKDYKDNKNKDDVDIYEGKSVDDVIIDNVKHLYNTFISRYMRFLKFRNSVTTQFTTDAHFHIEDCSLVINKKFRDFMNFDISIASVMQRFQYFINNDFEDIEEIVDKEGNYRLDQLYQLLFNQVLINTAPYYEYIIQLLETHEKIRRDLIKTIGRAQENLKKNIETMKKIKVGETISENVRQMIITYLIRMNPKGKIMFNKRITKDEMKKIKSIIDIYEEYCTDKIIDIFDASLEIQDVNDTIKLLKAELDDFNKLYESKLEAIKGAYAKKIFKQFLAETREYYRDASSSASRSVGSMPELADATSVPIGAQPSIPPPPVLPAPPPQPSQVMTNEDAINTLMEKFFN